jgi:hypothetical protein
MHRQRARYHHVLVKAATCVNNGAGDSHQPTRKRERQMCGATRCAAHAQAFLSCFGPIRQHLALPRHQMTVVRHRAILKERFANGTIGPSPALSMRLSVNDDYSYVEPVVDAH